MRIAHVIAGLEESRGGPSRSVRALADATARLGHQVELLCTGAAPAEESEGGLVVRSFQRDTPQWLCPSAGLAGYLGRSSFDVIQHHGLWLRPLHYASEVSTRTGVPLVISPRGMMSRWAWNHRRWRKQLAGRFVHPGALTAAAGWHATSEDEAEDIRRLGFTRPVCVAPNGVAVPAEADLARSHAHWRSLIPAVTRKRIALFYSRFHEKKRVVELIDLWLAEPPADWQLVLVGIPEGYSVAELRHHVERRGGAGHVLVFDGSNQPPPYAIASLFLLPSHSENFGLSIAEALAAGVPVLVTDATPWKELSVRQAGWCVPWEHYSATLRAARDEPPSTLRARGERGRAWMREAFSWETAARRLVDFYERIRTASTIVPPGR